MPDYMQPVAPSGMLPPVRQANPVYESQTLHENDDTDKDETSHHHTLGYRHGQAAPGEQVLEILNKSTLRVVKDDSSFGYPAISGGVINPGFTGTIITIGYALHAEAKLAEFVVNTSLRSGANAALFAGMHVQYKDGTWHPVCNQRWHNDADPPLTFAFNMLGFVNIEDTGLVLGDNITFRVDINVDLASGSGFTLHPWNWHTIQFAGGGRQGDIGPQGPVGPAGPAGSGGAGTLGYTFNQATPSAMWTINHTLSFIPNVLIVDSAGNEVEGDIKIMSSSQVIATFSAAFSGTAYLS